MITMTKKTSKKTDSGPLTIDCGEGHTALVDRDMWHFLVQYEWRSVKYYRSWYARLDQSYGDHRYSISMHRLIANTPSDMVCHHRNRNTMDNRRVNLCNMTRDAHNLLHKNNTLSIKFESMPPAASPPPEL